RWGHRTRRAAADDVRAIHQPDHHLPGGAVAPEDVGEAIGVEIALADDLPVAGHRPRRTAANDARAIDKPHHRLPGNGVAPEDVAPGISVEIMGRGESRPEETRRDESRRAEPQRAKQSPKSRSQVWTHCFLQARRIEKAHVYPSPFALI